MAGFVSPPVLDQVFERQPKRREASLKTAGRKPECGGDVGERQSACQGRGRECPQEGRDERRVFKSCVLCLQDHCFDLPANLTKRIGKRKVRGVEGNRDGVARAKRHFGAKLILVPAGGHPGSVRKLDMHRQVRDTRHPPHRPEDEGCDTFAHHAGVIGTSSMIAVDKPNPLSVRYQSVVEAPLQGRHVPDMRGKTFAKGPPDAQREACRPQCGRIGRRGKIEPQRLVARLSCKQGKQCRDPGSRNDLPVPVRVVTVQPDGGKDGQMVDPTLGGNPWYHVGYRQAGWEAVEHRGGLSQVPRRSKPTAS